MIDKLIRRSRNAAREDAMKQLHAIFADDPQRSVISLAGGTDASRVECFREARQSGTLAGRKVVGLWLTEEATPQPDVLEIYGRVPLDIHIRHDVWKTAKPAL
jgi:hypothetical protein